jgi:hypothetical protein
MDGRELEGGQVAAENIVVSYIMLYDALGTSFSLKLFKYL